VYWEGNSFSVVIHAFIIIFAAGAVSRSTGVVLKIKQKRDIVGFQGVGV